MPSNSVYFDICLGDANEHSRLQTRYNQTRAILVKNADIYGLPSTLEEVSPEQQDLLRDLDVIMNATLLLSCTPLTPSLIRRNLSRCALWRLSLCWLGG
jgi:hypothetical protein